MDSMTMFKNKNKREIIQLLSQIRGYRKQYNAYLPLTNREQKILDKKFKEEEIFTSNHIEGNSYSLNDTRYLLDTGMAVSGKKIIDGIEVINVSKGIDYINNYTGEFTEEFIKKVHQIMVKNTLDSDIEECEYKQVKNYIGDLTTSSVEHTPIHMQKILKVFQQASSKEEKNTTKIIVDITEYKYRFLAIHPFIEGNGRTIRLLYNYLLRQNDFIPLSILPEDKESYYKALQDSDKENCDALIIFMCNALIKTYERRIAWLSQ